MCDCRPCRLPVDLPALLLHIYSQLQIKTVFLFFLLLRQVSAHNSHVEMFLIPEGLLIGGCL